MNTLNNAMLPRFRVTASAAAMLLLSGCAAEMYKDPGADRARVALTALQSDPQLANLAPEAIHDADIAVHDAEQPQADRALATHLAYVADRRVLIAKAQAQTRLVEEQRKTLVAQSDRIQLDARTREADTANRKNDELQSQLTALQARKTDRGMVLTLGDVLFSTGRADLKPGGVANLDRLSTYLAQATDRSIRIEGHTDDRGGQALNQTLSKKRADSVADYLIGRGLSGGRVTSIGEGYSSPVADNSTEAGRQANRRVEVIIQNVPMQ